MVSVARTITGSIGSRVRLIFGDSGHEWLLLLNHDNGNRQWQVKDWGGGIPDNVAKQMNNCTQKGRNVNAVDFGPTGAWYVNGAKPDGSGNHSWWGGTIATDTLKELSSGPHKVQASFGSNSFGRETSVFIQGNNGYNISFGLSDDLENRLERIHSSQKTVHFVRLFNNGQYFISDSEGMEWNLGNSINFSEELQKSVKTEEVAMAEDGSWVVVRENHYVASTGVDDKLTKALTKFFSDQRKWVNERKKEIREARAAEERAAAQEVREREAREAAERAAAEAAERAERERILQETREAELAIELEERERVRREMREAERAEREATMDAERERIRREREAESDAATRISTLEAKLEERLVEEAKDIKETEKTIKEMEAKLQSRKRSLHDAMQSMPPEIQGRVDLGGENQGADTSADGNDNICVVCQDASAVMAVVPCGHVCLCNACSDVCINRQDASRLCPLCRGNMQSVFRIYVGR